jgi:hypothetical protein
VCFEGGIALLFQCGVEGVVVTTATSALVGDETSFYIRDSRIVNTIFDPCDQAVTDVTFLAVSR